MSYADLPAFLAELDREDLVPSIVSEPLEQARAGDLEAAMALAKALLQCRRPALRRALFAAIEDLEHPRARPLVVEQVAGDEDLARLAPETWRTEMLAVTRRRQLPGLLERVSQGDLAALDLLLDLTDETGDTRYLQKLADPDLLREAWGQVRGLESTPSWQALAPRAAVRGLCDEAEAQLVACDHPLFFFFYGPPEDDRDVVLHYFEDADPELRLAILRRLRDTNRGWAPFPRDETEHELVVEILEQSQNWEALHKLASEVPLFLGLATLTRIGQAPDIPPGELLRLGWTVSDELDGGSIHALRIAPLPMESGLAALTREALVLPEGEHPAESVHCCAVSPDGQQLAFCSPRNPPRLVPLEAARRRPRPHARYRDGSVGLLFSPDQGWLFRAERERLEGYRLGTRQVWRRLMEREVGAAAGEFEELAQHDRFFSQLGRRGAHCEPVPITSLAVSACGGALAVGRRDGRVELLSVETGQTRNVLREEGPSGQILVRLAEDRRIAVADPHCLTLYSPRGKLLQSFSWPGVKDVAFSGSGLLAVLANNAIARVDGGEVRIIAGSARASALDPSGSVTAQLTASLQVLDAEGRPLAEYPLPQADRLEFSDDGSLLLALEFGQYAAWGAGMHPAEIALPRPAPPAADEPLPGLTLEIQQGLVALGADLSLLPRRPELVDPFDRSLELPPPAPGARPLGHSPGELCHRLLTTGPGPRRSHLQQALTVMLRELALGQSVPPPPVSHARLR